MPKYYVASGDLEIACDSDIPKNAAISAFRRMKNVRELGKLTVVSERGFDSDCENNIYFNTSDLLDETDQLENFKSTEWLE